MEVLPAEIGYLRDLENLEITHNSLKALPPEIGKLKNLKKRLKFIDASDNPLQTLPLNIARLPKLSALRLDNSTQLNTLDADLQTFWTNKNCSSIAPS